MRSSASVATELTEPKRYCSGKDSLPPMVVTIVAKTGRSAGTGARSGWQLPLQIPVNRSREARECLNGPIGCNPPVRKDFATQVGRTCARQKERRQVVVR